MPSSFAFAVISKTLPYETKLKHINGCINKIMDKNRVKRESFDKKILFGKKILFSEKVPFCLLSKTAFLNLDTVDVIYTPKT